LFISEEFWFDNIFSKDMGILLVSMDSDVLNEYGLTYTEDLEADSTFNNNPYFKGKKETAQTITLCFCLADMNGKAYVWDDHKTEAIFDWLIQEDFKPFVSKDNIELTYYLKAKKIAKKFTKNMTGYLEIEFQPFTNYSYKDFVKPIEVNGTKELKINNSTNTDDEYYFPILEIENLGQGEIIIENTSIDREALVLKYLELNEKIVVDNLLYVVQNTDGVNRFDCCNRSWLRLKKGENLLKFTGKYNVVVKAKFPIIR